MEFRKTLPLKSYGVKKPICIGRMLLQRLAGGATGARSGLKLQHAPCCEASFAHAPNADSVVC